MSYLNIFWVEVKARGELREGVVEVVLEPGDIVEVRGVAREVSVEELVEDLEGGPVLLGVDGVAHHLAHLLEVVAVPLVDQADVEQQIAFKE